MHIFGARDNDAGTSPPVGASAAALPQRVAAVDLRPSCLPVQNQIGNRCVGQGFKEAHWIALRGQTQPMSSLFAWTGARVREQTRVNGQIPDVGCQPNDCYNAAIEAGVCAHDAREDDPAAVSQCSTWVEVVQAASHKFSVSDFLPIAPGDTNTLDRLLSAGFGACFVMRVTSSYEQYSGGVWLPGGNEDTIGDHQQVFVGYTTNGDYIVQNSWGNGWGISGFAIIGRFYVATRATSIVGIIGGPKL